MSILNPQSIISSRLHTNNNLKDINDTRKIEISERNKVMMDLNSIKIKSGNNYEVVEGKLVENEESKNYGSTFNNEKNKNDNKIIIERYESDKLSKRDDNLSFDDKILKTKQNDVYITFNRLLHSKNCVYFYIGLMIVSIIVLLYSIFGFFAKLSKLNFLLILDELPILICEIILITIITIDMIVRIISQGCRAFFSKGLNWLDLVLLILSIVTIVMYLKIQDIAQQIEDISFALLIMIRNSSQFLRLLVLMKNQQEVRKNVEEIIHFSSEFGEKKFELENKDTKNKKDILSFVEGNNSMRETNKKDYQSNNLTSFHENH